MGRVSAEVPVWYELLFFVSRRLWHCRRADIMGHFPFTADLFPDGDETSFVLPIALLSDSGDVVLAGLNRHVAGIRKLNRFGCPARRLLRIICKQLRIPGLEGRRSHQRLDMLAICDSVICEHGSFSSCIARLGRL